MLSKKYWGTNNLILADTIMNTPFYFFYETRENFSLSFAVVIHKCRSINYPNFSSCIKNVAIIRFRSDLVSFSSNFFTLEFIHWNFYSDKKEAI
jgi:hypothetical protein